MQATLWSFVATAAFAFGFILPYRGRKDTIDFVTGFLVEKSLSVDNLFVFTLIFSYFKVPRAGEERVLNVGILSALVLRGAMILGGVEVVNRFEPALLGFAAVLLYSSYSMFTAGEEEEDLEDNQLIQGVRRLIPVTNRYDGTNFFTEVDGRPAATPLLLVLVAIELSDLIFAVDSIPAVFGVSRDPFIIYTSNIFAIVGLRSLYSLVADSLDEFAYLDKAIAAVLGFIGAKMVADFAGFHVSDAASLAVTLGTLGAGVGASLLFPGADEAAEREE